MRTGRVLAAVLGLLCLLATAYWLGRTSSGRISIAYDPPALVKEIQQLHELTTVKYTIQKVVGIKEAKQPLGSESLLLVVQAQVLGGIDLSQLTADQVQTNGSRAVTIRLPAPRVLHVVIDEKQTKVWDRQVTWWTPWVPFNPDLERQARLTAIEDVRQTAMEMGILTEAQRNAETSIRNLLRSVGIESVVFIPQKPST